MFLSVHTTLALAIATLPLPYWSLFILAFGSHYFLDSLPHGDEDLMKNKLTKRKAIERILIAVLIDSVIILLILFLFFIKNKFNFYILIIVFLACLPDGLEFLNIVTDKKFKLINRLSLFHHKIHNFLKIKYPLLLGIFIQSLILVLLLLLII